MSGIGVGACLPLLGSAALAAVPGGRYAAASALVSSARQLGGVLGISILVLIVGNPAGPSVVDALRDGWLVSIAAFVLVAMVAAPIGKVVTRREAEEVEHGEPLLLLPDSQHLAAEPLRVASPVGLTDIPLVAALSHSARVILAAASRTISLDAGAWLFREGDSPGSAYLLRSGRIEVVQGDQLVRTLTPAPSWASCRSSPACRGPPAYGPAGTRRSSRYRARRSTDCSNGTRGPPGPC